MAANRRLRAFNATSPAVGSVLCTYALPRWVARSHAGASLWDRRLDAGIECRRGYRGFLSTVADWFNLGRVKHLAIGSAGRALYADKTFNHPKMPIVVRHPS